MNSLSRFQVPLGLGRLIRRSAGLVLRHPGLVAVNLALQSATILLTEALVETPAGRGVAPIDAVVAATGADVVSDAGGPSGWVTVAIVLIVLLVCLAVVMLIAGVLGAIRIAAVEAALGRRARPWLYLRRATWFSLPWLLTSVAVSLLTGLGLIFFIVPALYVFARYLPWSMAVLFEGRGYHGLGRARDLTAGYRWPIVGALAPIGLAWLMVSGTVLSAQSWGAGGMATTIASIVCATLFGTFLNFFEAVVYLRLVEVQDGTPPPLLETRRRHAEIALA